jgi:hypothetical protein
MVGYVYDCNYIKVTPMKCRSASEWVEAYDSIHQELTVKGFKPKLQTLEKEASTTLKTFFTINDIAYQLVPPHYNRRNDVERAISTFKEHFVAVLSSVDPAFPLHLWDRLLPQAEIKLNLLRILRLGLVDYNKTAFAPPRCKIIAHKKPGKRRTWAPLCIITDVKMYTYRPRPVNASWTLSSSFPTIIKYHSYHPLTDYSSLQKTRWKLYKILIQKCHSLASAMTPSRPLPT